MQPKLIGGKICSLGLTENTLAQILPKDIKKLSISSTDEIRAEFINNYTLLEELTLINNPYLNVDDLRLPYLKSLCVDCSVDSSTIARNSTITMLSCDSINGEDIIHCDLTHLRLAKPMFKQLIMPALRYLNVGGALEDKHIENLNKLITLIMRDACATVTIKTLEHMETLKYIETRAHLDYSSIYDRLVGLNAPDISSAFFSYKKNKKSFAIEDKWY